MRLRHTRFAVLLCLEISWAIKMGLGWGQAMQLNYQRRRPRVLALGWELRGCGDSTMAGDPMGMGVLH